MYIISYKNSFSFIFKITTQATPNRSGLWPGRLGVKGAMAPNPIKTKLLPHV